MCGLFAAANLSSGRTELSERRARSVLMTLNHRGPDGSGLSWSPEVVLGHTRLAIIDLEQGKQPMYDPESGLRITFNGEIFNHRELRRTLESLGHRFRTHSDTEVILKAYAEWREEAAVRLRGMFAFVIHDAKRGEIFAARDRFGIKPLYHASVGDTHFFASEMAPLFATGQVAPEKDESRYAEFLVFGYAAGAATMFKTVRTLEAGHYARLSRSGLQTRRYWYPFDGRTALNDVPEADAVDRLEHLVCDAVDAWSLADVPVGALMSGGVDSPLIAAIADRHIPDFHTYSLSFERDGDIDETPLIEGLVRDLGLRNTLLSLSDDDMLQTLQDLTDHFDEPIVDPNNLVLMGLCAEIRKESDLKVVLCGEGADEIFGGYGRHRVLSGDPKYCTEAREMALGLGQVAIPRLQMIAGDTDFPMPERLAAIGGLVSSDPVNRTLEYDQLTFLSTRLHSQDRIGMYYGMEIRTPFLDHHLVEFANGLPGHMKVSPGWSKYVLRQVASRYISDEVAWNKKKIGLSIPYSRLLESGDLRRLFEDRVLDGELSKVFDRKGLASLLAEHRPSQGGADHSNTLWRLLALSSWAERPMPSRAGAALAVS
jgi:asparagine synthase (glutamine-hydrolysing)